MTTTALPTIIRFIGRNDSGEYGNDNCAHCGAKGRYQFTFECNDGHRHAAMAGCIQLYPVSPIAVEHKKLIEKDAATARSGRKLNGWDTKKLEAIQAFYAGSTTEAAARQVIDDQNRACANWAARKFGGRS